MAYLQLQLQCKCWSLLTKHEFLSTGSSKWQPTAQPTLKTKSHITATEKATNSGDKTAYNCIHTNQHDMLNGIYSLQAGNDLLKLHKQPSVIRGTFFKRLLKLIIRQLKTDQHLRNLSRYQHLKLLNTARCVHSELQHSNQQYRTSCR